MEQLITAIASAVVGGGLTLIGSYVSNNAAAKRYEMQLLHEARQRKEEILRTRGEELHAATSAWLKRIFIRHFRFYSVALGDMTYRQAQSQEIDDSKTVHDVGRIELLIDVYFPSTRGPYDAYVAERDRAEEIRLEFKRKWGKYDERLIKADDFALQYERSQAIMQEAGDALQKSIVASIRTL